MSKDRLTVKASYGLREGWLFVIRLLLEGEPTEPIFRRDDYTSQEEALKAGREFAERIKSADIQEIKT